MSACRGGQLQPRTAGTLPWQPEPDNSVLVSSHCLQAVERPDRFLEACPCSITVALARAFGGAERSFLEPTARFAARRKRALILWVANFSPLSSLMTPDPRCELKSSREFLEKSAVCVLGH